LFVYRHNEVTYLLFWYGNKGNISNIFHYFLFSLETGFDFFCIRAEDWLLVMGKRTFMWNTWWFFKLSCIWTEFMLQILELIVRLSCSNHSNIIFLNSLVSSARPLEECWIWGYRYTHSLNRYCRDAFYITIYIPVIYKYWAVPSLSYCCGSC
jgi:hypothetical protein